MSAKYLIIGSGKTSRHFSHYLQLLGLSIDTWNRKQDISQLHKDLKEVTHVVLAISDPAIEAFYQEHLQNYAGQVLHLSGSLQIQGVQACHPLMTFGLDLYDLETYQNIAFVLDTGSTLTDLLPGLANKFFTIQPQQRAMYHALCVAGGNFTTLLWTEMSKGFQELGLPTEIVKPYLQQVLNNFLTRGADSLTGPIARKDYVTVESNIKALEGSPLAEIYRSFADVYLPRLSSAKPIRRRA